ncbi:hypothetical protein LUU34_01613600 [Aix galericulata]|nr:hypothetical protein LUU34_01613600 [Aix galericulata]
MTKPISQSQATAFQSVTNRSVPVGRTLQLMTNHGIQLGQTHQPMTNKGFLVGQNPLGNVPLAKLFSRWPTTAFQLAKPIN